MPFVANQKQLETLIIDAITRPEIIKKVGTLNLSKKILANEIIPKAVDIWNKSAGEIKRFNEFEKETTAQIKRITDKILEEKGIKPLVDPLTDEKSIRDRSRYSLYSRVVNWITAGILTALLIVYISFGFYLSWSVLLGWTISLIGIFSVFGAIVLIAALLGLSANLRNRSDEFRAISYYRDKAYEYNLEANEVSKDNKEIEALQKSLLEARLTLHNTIIEKEILPIIRPVLNNWLDPVYSTNIKVFEAPGLAEVFNSAYEVATVSKEKLEFLLHNMPGGSIGIAGPRGVGKTTLISAYCRTRINPIQNRPVLPVMTSAPVEYQFRDFILHLFSMVCLRALDAEDIKYKPSISQDSEMSEQSVNPPVMRQMRTLLRFLAPFSLVAFYLGIILILLSLITAGMLLWEQRANQTAPAAAANSNTNVTAANIANSNSNSGQEATAAVNSNTNSAGQTETREINKQSREGFFTTLTKIMDFKPGYYLSLGIILALTGFLLLRRRQSLALEEYERREEYKRRNTDNSTDGENSSALLRDKAFEWLEMIKFQQSLTTGWSGALKLPVGLEAGLSSAKNIARQQLSLPEIVQGYTDFLALVRNKYQIIIGIDELDKLESDETAQRFLNDIKSVFGIDRCFYLVSVSENAMSSFEQRGIPFRDVFDSSFDGIIYMDYMDYQTAKSLIEQRVIGMPIPFIGFCYCFSGGLARDLIRVCRNIMEIIKKDPSKNSLSDLVKHIIEEDLRGKIRAVFVSIKKIKLKETSYFIKQLHTLHSKLNPIDLLAEQVKELDKFLTAEKKRRQSENTPVKSRPKKSETTLKESKEVAAGNNGGDLISAAVETKPKEETEELYEALHTTFENLIIYIYYQLTLLEVFNDEFNESKIKEAENALFDKLARARQTLSLSGEITKILLDEIREAKNMQSVKILS